MAAEEADPKGLSSLEAFESRYEEIVQAVEAGRLTGEVGRKAKDLWVSLRREVLELNARIEAFKLEAREYDGSRQEQAIEGLTQAVAERERTLARYIRLLDRLAAQRQGVVFTNPWQKTWLGKRSQRASLALRLNSGQRT